MLASSRHLESLSSQGQGGGRLLDEVARRHATARAHIRRPHDLHPGAPPLLTDCAARHRDRPCRLPGAPSPCEAARAAWATLARPSTCDVQALSAAGKDQPRGVLPTPPSRPPDRPRPTASPICRAPRIRVASAPGASAATDPPAATHLIGGAHLADEHRPITPPHDDPRSPVSAPWLSPALALRKLTAGPIQSGAERTSFRPPRKLSPKSFL